MINAVVWAKLADKALGLLKEAIVPILYVSAVVALFLFLRFVWINEGKTRCENAVVAETQQKVIDDENKLRPVRSYRPSVERVAQRMRDGTF